MSLNWSSSASVVIAVKDIPYKYIAIPPGAHKSERVTDPILGLCHGAFTDQYIFRNILGRFYPRKKNSAMSMSTFEVQGVPKVRSSTL